MWMRSLMLTKARYVFFVLLAWVAVAWADTTNYPNRPVRLIVPVAAGSGIDNVARLLADSLGKRMGQPVTVDNRPGAGHVIATNAVARATPDGYTLLLAGAPIALNDALGMTLPYSVDKDLLPISMVASVPALFVVHPSTPYHTLADVIRAAKGNAAATMYAVASTGSITHLLGEAMRHLTGANVQMVAYKGSSSALPDVLAGRVPVFIDAYIPTGPLVTEGKLRGIAIASTRRSPLLPNVPTVVEAGFPDLVGSGFFGLVAPANTPRAVVEQLHRHVVDALKDPQLNSKLISQGYEVHGSSPAEYKAHIRAETERWTPIVKAAGIK